MGADGIVLEVEDEFTILVERTRARDDAVGDDENGIRDGRRDVRRAPLAHMRDLVLRDDEELTSGKAVEIRADDGVGEKVLADRRLEGKSGNA